LGIVPGKTLQASRRLDARFRSSRLIPITAPFGIVGHDTRQGSFGEASVDKRSREDQRRPPGPSVRTAFPQGTQRVLRRDLQLATSLTSVWVVSQLSAKSTKQPFFSDAKAISLAIAAKKGLETSGTTTPDQTAPPRLQRTRPSDGFELKTVRVFSGLPEPFFSLIRNFFPRPIQRP